MQEVRFTIKKRAFPSQGRVRLNIAHLPELGIREGEHVDLVNEATKKTVTATVIADTMVREGQVRVSDEDLKAVGLQDDDEVLVRKTPPLKEKIKKVAADANVSLKRGVDDLDHAVKKTSGEIRGASEKTAASVKKETKKAADSVGKAAAKTAKTVKKAVKKAAGNGDDL
jgi:nitrogen-specific signal transduction histidine kinase